MTNSSLRLSILTVWVLPFALLLELFLSLQYGSVSISNADLYLIISNGLLGPEKITAVGQGPLHDIIWLLRMPRLLLACCAGAGLAVCGVVMQAIVRNPLADPYILGVSSGASLGATLSILLGGSLAWNGNFIGICAFIGAMAASTLVLFITSLGNQTDTTKLLLSGMAINTACSAATSFIVYFANDKEGMQTVIFWLMGSFSGANWNDLPVILTITITGCFLFWSQYRILDMMLLGDSTAITLGTSLRTYRRLYLLLSACMVGFIVYAAGMIGFVGLLVPHIVRNFSGSSHRRLLPASMFVGAMLLICADTLCRTLVSQTEIPVGILISLLGAPCFIFLISRKTTALRGGR